MGSVMNVIDCPNCGNEAHNDFYYKTGEEYTFCPNCGYHKSVTIKDKSKDLSEITDDDIEVDELTNPFGAFRVKWKESVGWEVGTIVDEKHLKRIEAVLEENKDNIEESYYSKLENGEIKTIHFLF